MPDTSPQCKYRTSQKVDDTTYLETYEACPYAEIASRWLTDCIATHDLCRHTSSSSKLPPRVIDVLSREEPFLVDTDDLLSVGDYATLSYCWGPTRDPRMATYGPRSKGRRGQPDPIPNIDAHKIAIPFSSMPATLRDAVSFTRQLGVRYLWIDAFCIVQGDEEEWNKVNPMMADIYANARFTIAAGNAHGIETGFLGKLGGKRHEPPRTPDVPPLVGRRNGLNPNVTSCHHGNSSLKTGALTQKPTRTGGLRIPPSLSWAPSPLCLDEPLNTRAWALSEAIFSNRTLHFTSSAGLIWECNQVRRTQISHQIPRDEEGSTLAWKLTAIQDSDPSSFRIFRNIDLAKQSISTTRELYRRWDTVVEHFTRRQINSNPLDRYKDDQRLVALHRVAARFAYILKEGFGVEDTYLAGIWKGDLPGGLLWTVELFEFELRAEEWARDGYGMNSTNHTCAILDGSLDDKHEHKKNGQGHGQWRWRRASIARAPSWSWASIEGPVSVWGHVLEPHVPDGVQIGRLTVLEASTIRVDDNEPFSRVRSGRLVVRGWIIHGLSGVASKLENSGEGDPVAAHRCRVGAGRGVAQGIPFVCDVPIEDIGGIEEVSCLYIGMEGSEFAAGKTEPARHVFLLLRALRCQESYGVAFERIGISGLDTREDHVDSILGLLEEEIVEII